MRNHVASLVVALGCVSYSLLPRLGHAASEQANNANRPVYALVVGNNQTIEGQSELRYADDDAVQNAAFAIQIGGAKNVVLLTHLDEDTAEMYPGLNPLDPSKENLSEAMDRLNQQMRSDKKQGANPEFFFFYTGHGNVKNNAGYITLSDGSFTRDDLRALVKESEASRNHLIIDACKSYFMVFERGTGGRRKHVSGKFISNDDLPENTGVFLSTSSAANSHEWEAISAGVFSHEVRSALRGGADLDLNQKITYQEAAAFIWNANRGIPLKKFRPNFFMQPPGGETANDSVLADLSDANGDWLHATPAKEARQYIEDAKGYRIAEFHPSSTQNIAILIPSERPLFVRESDRLMEYVLPKSSRIELTSLKPGEADVLTRGAENLAFQELFTDPFGVGALDAYSTEDNLNAFELSLEEDVTADSKRGLKVVRNSLGVAATLLGASGLSMTLSAYATKKMIKNDASNLRTVKHNNTIRRLNTGSVVCYAVAGAAFTSWLIWTIASKKRKRPQKQDWSYYGMTLERRF